MSSVVDAPQRMVHTDSAFDPTEGGRTCADLVHFNPVVELTKTEVFDACSTLAKAERLLEAGGHHETADRIMALFEVLEHLVSRS